MKFEKCITCPRIGVSCVPNLWLLPFPDLIEWDVKRAKILNWSNQKWADRSNTPVGTIARLKAGDYSDCYYSTIRSMTIAVIGGTTDEFSCTEQVEKDLRQMEKDLRRTEEYEKQAELLFCAEQENKALKDRLACIEEQHRHDVRAIREEYREQLQEHREEIAFLREELKAWQKR